tara:strand:+ start:18666 stop:19265 length:600 start_codon:yes stop_codon:yes gene_type:complete
MGLHRIGKRDLRGSEETKFYKEWAIKGRLESSASAAKWFYPYSKNTFSYYSSDRDGVDATVSIDESSANVNAALPSTLADIQDYTGQLRVLYDCKLIKFDVYLTNWSSDPWLYEAAVCKFTPAYNTGTEPTLTQLGSNLQLSAATQYYLYNADQGLDVTLTKGDCIVPFIRRKHQPGSGSTATTGQDTSVVFTMAFEHV